MTPKTQRKYELIASIAHGDGNAVANLAQLCEIDFTTAFDMFELALGKTNTLELARDGLAVFEAASPTKTRQLFAESGPIQKLLYSSPAVGDKRLINFFVGFVLSNKIEIADECLMRMKANAFVDFNENLRVIIDALFATYCKEKGVIVPAFNKKQKTLLIEYINKIKGPNKALLLQRMKEIG